MRGTMLVESLNGDKYVNVECKLKNYFVATMKTQKGDIYEMSLAGDYETCYHYAVSRADECVAFRTMTLTLIKEV